MFTRSSHALVGHLLVGLTCVMIVSPGSATASSPLLIMSKADARESWTRVLRRGQVARNRRRGALAGQHMRSKAGVKSDAEAQPASGLEAEPAVSPDVVSGSGDE